MAQEKQPEQTEPGFRDYLGRYNALDSLNKEHQEKPYDAGLVKTIGSVLGIDEAAYGITPDKLHREVLIRKDGTKAKLTEQIDADLEGIIDTETEGFDLKATSNLLIYMASNSAPVVADPENPTQTEGFHSQLYRAAKVEEARKENPEMAKELMLQSLRPFYGEMIDRLTINQPQVLDSLYGSYVETATEQYLKTFMGETEEGKEPKYNMDAVKGYVANTMKSTDAETKIKLANGLVSIKEQN